MFRGMSCDRLGPLDFLRTSGGLFLDLASHDFDAARFLTGEEITEVFAIGAVLVEPELATFDDVDYGIVLLRFANGALGVVQESWRAPYGYDIRAEVHGSKGKVVTEVDEKYPATLYDSRGKVVRAPRPVPGAIRRRLPGGAASVRRRAARRSGAHARDRGRLAGAAHRGGGNAQPAGRDLGPHRRCLDLSGHGTGVFTAYNRTGA